MMKRFSPLNLVLGLLILSVATTSVNASDLDGEFDAIQTAFSTSGHTHDGTAAEGGVITVVGPAQEFLGDGTAWYPKTDATYDLGKSTASFDVAFVESINLGGTAITASATEINYVDGVEQ